MHCPGSRHCAYELIAGHYWTNFRYQIIFVRCCSAGAQTVCIWFWPLVYCNSPRILLALIERVQSQKAFLMFSSVTRHRVLKVFIYALHIPWKPVLDSNSTAGILAIGVRFSCFSELSSFLTGEIKSLHSMHPWSLVLLYFHSHYLRYWLH